MVRKISLVSVFVLLTGCASFNADVLTYYDDSKLNYNETFVVMPKKNQDGSSLSFKHGASVLSSVLATKGFVPVSNPAKAKYVVFYDYKVERGGLVSYKVPVMGNVGTVIKEEKSNLSNGSYNKVMQVEPVKGVVGYDTKQYMQYNRELFVDIYKKLPNGSKEQVYSGNATNYSPNYSMENVKGCLVKALFDDFPGKNGSVVEVSVKSCEL